MNKFIDEQIRLRREAAKMERQKREQGNQISVNNINYYELSGLPCPRLLRKELMTFSCIH